MYFLQLYREKINKDLNDKKWQVQIGFRFRMINQSHLYSPIDETIVINENFQEKIEIIVYNKNFLSLKVEKSYLIDFISNFQFNLQIRLL